jgi:transketolase
MGWWRYVGAGGDVVGIENRFGASAPYKTLFEEYGFTGDNIASRVLRLLGRAG